MTETLYAIRYKANKVLIHERLVIGKWSECKPEAFGEVQFHETLEAARLALWKLRSDKRKALGLGAIPDYELEIVTLRIDPVFP